MDGCFVACPLLEVNSQTDSYFAEEEEGSGAVVCEFAILDDLIPHIVVPVVIAVGCGGGFTAGRISSICKCLKMILGGKEDVIICCFYGCGSCIPENSRCHLLQGSHYNFVSLEP